MMPRTPEDVEDELLVLRVQGGDADALAPLLARCSPRLNGLATRLTGDREAARDVVQDALFAIVRKIGGLHDPARFRTWAYRIVANRCADWVRRGAVRRAAMLQAAQSAPIASAAPPVVAEGAAETDRLRAAIGLLTDEHRMTLVLHYVDGLSVVEIASVLAVPDGTVKSRLHLARQELKRTLQGGNP